VNELYDKFEDFRRAYDQDGMTPEEFDDFGATRRTLRQFTAGYGDFVRVLRDFMIPDPDLT
jgi:transaldolase